MVFALVATGQGAYLRKFWFKQVDEQAKCNQNCENKQVDCLYVTLVVPEVQPQETQDGKPASHLDGGALYGAVTPVRLVNIEGRYTVMYLR